MLLHAARTWRCGPVTIHQKLVYSVGDHYSVPLRHKWSGTVKTSSIPCPPHTVQHSQRFQRPHVAAWLNADHYALLVDSPMDGKPRALWTQFVF
jgi:hypothetical protein